MQKGTRGRERWYPVATPGLAPWIRLIDCGHVPAKRSAEPPAGRALSCHGLFWFAAGHGRWQTRHEAGAICAGDVLIFRPGQWHLIAPEAGTSLDEFWLCLEGPLVDGLSTALGTAVHTRVNDGQDWRQRWEGLLACCASGRPGPGHQATAQALAMLTDVLAQLLEPADASSNGAVARYLALVDAHLHEREAPLPPFLHAEGLAFASFRKRFRAYTGLYPHSWWLQAKLRRAKELLQESDLPIGAVGAAVGLPNKAWFAQWFRRATGSSPSAFRARR